MTDSRTFGRRAGSGAAFPRAKIADTGATRPGPTGTAPAATVTPLPIASNPSVDDELDAWRRERIRAYRLPWRQLLLVGSLSFFIASFVLPASVNGTVDWVFDLLSVASLLAWFAGRGKKSPAAFSQSCEDM